MTNGLAYRLSCENNLGNMYSTRGAQASVVIYSLVETAKANNLNVTLQSTRWHRQEARQKPWILSVVVHFGWSISERASFHSSGTRFSNYPDLRFPFRRNDVVFTPEKSLTLVRSNYSYREYRKSPVAECSGSASPAKRQILEQLSYDYDMVQKVLTIEDLRFWA